MNEDAVLLRAWSMQMPAFASSKRCIPETSLSLLVELEVDIEINPVEAPVNGKKVPNWGAPVLAKTLRGLK